MKDKIAEVIKLSRGIAYFGTDEELDVTVCELLDLIAKELPKEKEEYGIATTFLRAIKNKEHIIYNQCLKDIKHKLGVE